MFSSITEACIEYQINTLQCKAAISDECMLLLGYSKFFATFSILKFSD